MASTDSIVSILKSTVHGRRPTNDVKKAGQPFVNFADMQFGIINTVGVPKDLLAVRFWLSGAKYRVDDLVTYIGEIYKCVTANQDVTWTAANWKEVKGEQGIQGVPGVPGADGTAGIPGVDGGDGPQGVQGVAGSKGDTGITGPQGNKGDPGAIGHIGLDGPKGDTGVAGVDGTNIHIKGAIATHTLLEHVIGAKPGDVYLETASGNFWVYDPTAPRVHDHDWHDVGHVQGPPGVVGHIGVTGPKGEPGAVGHIGATGNRGATGTTGATGAALTVNRTVHATTGNPSVTQSGNTLTFTLKTGATGHIGTPGHVGPRGGTGAKGAKGAKAVVRGGTANPRGGVTGDLYIQY